MKKMMFEYEQKIRSKVEKDQINSMLKEVRDIRENIVGQFDMIKAGQQSLEQRVSSSTN